MTRFNFSKLTKEERFHSWYRGRSRAALFKLFSMRKRPVDEFLLAPTTANHTFKHSRSISIKSHGRMIPRFRALTVQKQNYTALVTSWFSSYDPSIRSRLSFFLGYTFFCFFSLLTFASLCVVRRLKSKERESEGEYWFANSDKYIVVFLCKCNFFLFFFFCKHNRRSGI